MSRYTIDLACDVEIYPGLILRGRVEVTVERYGGETSFEDHAVFAEDKNGREQEVDWDDLSPHAQDMIERQINTYLLERRLCA